MAYGQTGSGGNVDNIALIAIATCSAPLVVVWDLVLNHDELNSPTFVLRILLDADFILCSALMRLILKQVHVKSHIFSSLNLISSLSLSFTSSHYS